MNLELLDREIFGMICGSNGIEVRRNLYKTLPAGANLITRQTVVCASCGAASQAAPDCFAGKAL